MGTSQASISANSPIAAAALYGPSGRPRGADMVQGGVGDCYLISTLGQYADRQPDVIRDAIRYDEKDRTFHAASTTRPDEKRRSRSRRMICGPIGHPALIIREAPIARHIGVGRMPTAPRRPHGRR